MFRITSGKGFHITFDNGYTISVQFGPGNYCENYNRKIGSEEVDCGKEGSNTAECAAWGINGELLELPFGIGDKVSNRSNATMVLKLMNWIARLPKGVKKAAK